MIENKTNFGEAWIYFERGQITSENKKRSDEKEEEESGKTKQFLVISLPFSLSAVAFLTLFVSTSEKTPNYY